jgi:hypothetical protein
MGLRARALLYRYSRTASEDRATAMLRVFVRLVSFVIAKRRAGAADRRIARPTGRWSQSTDEAIEPRPMHQDQTTCAGGALGSCRTGATLRVASKSGSNASPYPQAASRARSRHTLLSTPGTAVPPKRIQVFLKCGKGVPLASPGVGIPRRRHPQGGASLCPGLSPYAPLGLGDDDPIARGLSPGLLFGGAARLNRCGVYSHSPRLAPRRLTGSITYR